MGNTNIKKPELVSPAGNWSALYSAIESGADSIYFGVKGINMRNLASNFDIFEIKKVMHTLHNKHKKGYLALNVIAYNQEVDKITNILEEAKKWEVDAVILWDMGIFHLAKKIGLKIHLSTQASVSNFLSVKEYNSLGVKRIVLARECELGDIKHIISQINSQDIDCEVEAFIHGAMCISLSGRCLLSEYTFLKSANRGECLQPCRREFVIMDKDQESEYILGEDYVLSPKDLCSIEFIDKLIESGISAFKIEGRNRSQEYTRVVTSVYRKAIDSYFNGNFNEELKQELKEQLYSVYNRGFSDGFYFGIQEKAISRKLENSYEKIFLGEVVKFYKKIGVAEIRIRNGELKKGDTVLCIGKKTPAFFTIAKDIQINHAFVNILSRGDVGGVKLSSFAKPKDKVFIWRKKDIKAFDNL